MVPNTLPLMNCLMKMREMKKDFSFSVNGDNSNEMMSPKSLLSSPVAKPDESQDARPPSPKKAPVSPVRPVKPSPGKMGLPDNSGLIVGVNTINYDASSSLRNKAKSREERKMEMIMKAFEAMERAEQKKKEDAAVEKGRLDKMITD